MKEEETYGINKKFAHKRAIELVPEEFFWDCTDELAPFGSDEGDMALREFRDWRKRNPKISTYECLKWTIESVGEMSIKDYNDKLLNFELVKSQVEDENFNDQQYIFTLDISVIATGFAQLVDEGIIEKENKQLIKIAVERQKLWANTSENWEYKNYYLTNLNVLNRVLEKA